MSCKTKQTKQPGGADFNPQRRSFLGAAAAAAGVSMAPGVMLYGIGH
jgi:hypothetical protein